MADNRLAGSELKNLLKFPELKVIKFGANQVNKLDEIRVLVSNNSYVETTIGTLDSHYEFGFQ